MGLRGQVREIDVRGGAANACTCWGDALEENMVEQLQWSGGLDLLVLCM